MKNSRKAVEERQMNILNLVRTREEVSAEEIASTFGISKMTVRRDLQRSAFAGTVYPSSRLVSCRTGTHCSLTAA